MTDIFNYEHKIKQSLREAILIIKAHNSVILAKAGIQ